MDYSDTTINFLGVSVPKNSTKLPTDLFTKGTDSHQYLHVTSCHPYRCKKSVLYGLAIRIKRKAKFSQSTNQYASGSIIESNAYLFLTNISQFKFILNQPWPILSCATWYHFTNPY